MLSINPYKLRTHTLCRAGFGTGGCDLIREPSNTWPTCGGSSCAAGGRRHGGEPAVLHFRDLLSDGTSHSITAETSSQSGETQAKRDDTPQTQPDLQTAPSASSPQLSIIQSEQVTFCQTARFSFQEHNSSAAPRGVEAKGNRSEGSGIMGNSKDFRRFQPGTGDERKPFPSLG